MGSRQWPAISVSRANVLIGISSGFAVGGVTRYWYRRNDQSWIEIVDQFGAGSTFCAGANGGRKSDIATSPSIARRNPLGIVARRRPAALDARVGGSVGRIAPARARCLCPA